MFRLMAALAGAAALAYSLGTAVAQTGGDQIQLTEKQVQAYVAAHKKIVAVREELDKIAKASGFESLGEYDEVGVNIMLVFEGLDPKTKAFTEPPGTDQEADGECQGRRHTYALSSGAIVG